MKFATWTIMGLALSFAGSASAAKDKMTGGGKQTAAEMQAAMTRGAPGAQHRALEPLVGRFDITSRMWMAPNEPPQQATGTAEHRWVLGGRFVMMDLRSEMGGQPFHGIGFIGYDNVRGEYTSVWMDDMSTGIMRGTGTFDSASKTYKESGTFSCPMRNEKDIRYRSEWKMVDTDTYTYTMFAPGADGREMKAIEVTYVRVK
jgi:hypothetical protein